MCKFATILIPIVQILSSQSDVGLTAISFVGDPQLALLATRCRVQLALRRVSLTIRAADHVRFLNKILINLLLSSKEKQKP